MDLIPDIANSHLNVVAQSVMKELQTIEERAIK
jgi:hypothetical protein